MASAAAKAAKRAAREKEAKAKADPEQQQVDVLTHHVHQLSHAIATANARHIGTAADEETDEFDVDRTGDDAELDDGDDEDSDEQAIAEDEKPAPAHGTMAAAHHHSRHMPKLDGDIHDARIIDRPLTTAADG